VLSNNMFMRRWSDSGSCVDPIIISTIISTDNYIQEPEHYFKWDSGWSKTIPTNDPYPTLKESKNQEEEQPMKTLYDITVVTLDEEIILSEKVVAEDEDEARFAAFDVLKDKKLKPKDVTIIIEGIGSIKVRKKPQTVKVLRV